MTSQRHRVNRSSKRTTNRGPAAAAENRRAILLAARKLFTERGYDVPMSAIAQEAGVSQGVMYRHFPRRVELALEAFEDNFGIAEEIVAAGGDQTIYLLWDWLLERAVHDVGFIETMRAAREEVPTYDGPARLRAQLEVALERSRRAGNDLGSLQPEDFLRAWRMAYGLVVTARDSEVTAADLKRILSVEALLRMFSA